MRSIFSEEDISLIHGSLADTICVPRYNNKCLSKHKNRINFLINKIVKNKEDNERLINIWEKEKKFAEEWNIEVPDYPILKNINFSKEDIEIIRDVIEEAKKEYPTDDLLSTYLGESIKTFNFVITKINQELKNLEN